MEKIIYNGCSYRRYPDSPKSSDRRYFKRSQTPKNKEIYLHRQIWKDHYGEIPEGYHIHHKNHDTTDNRIENLELLEEYDHRSHHGKILTEPKKKNLDNIRFLTKEWHSSEEGRKWHSELWEKTLGKSLEEFEERTCDQCGKSFQTNVSQTRFCSNPCKSAWRRKSGVDNETRICVACGSAFVINKYYKTKTCSHKCKGVLVSKSKKEKKK